jgi:predicted chitinase
MLISPPFLPQRHLTDDDETWLRQALIGGRPGDGFFPVSYDMGWHGGIHLHAPVAEGGHERVRAIADGIVIYKREPTARVDELTHPQNYRGAWTDNGCVVLQHTSAIGEGTNASNIVFFSIYMHLSEVASTISVNRKITRKDILGQAGQIYGGTERKIHFEIVCDDANLQRFVGRANGTVDLSKSGRNDAIYGEIYVQIPSGTLIFSEQPIKHMRQAHRQPPKPSSKEPLPAPITLAAAAVTNEVLIIGLRHSVGTATQRGDVVVTTYKLNGEVMMPSLRENGTDYDVYNAAERLSKAYPRGNRPAPSAIIEIMRFGRILNSPPEQVPQEEVPHWREIIHNGVRAWVDLNATGTRKFSDADFPHWRGWALVDDAADGNSRCDSAKIKQLLGSVDGAIDPISAVAALNSVEKAAMLSKAICKFPSEWVSATIDQRWGWLCESSETNPVPMSGEDFIELRRHITALCIDNPLVTAAKWHWHPIEFIVQMRKCGWLSESELIRCVPSRYQTERDRRGSPIIRANVSLNEARQRVERRNAAIFMKGCRKYGIDSRQRLAHFLAQIFRETGVLIWDQELASGAEYEGRQDLGNTRPGDGVRFKGRGLIQTTGRTNYVKYSTYRGLYDTNSFAHEPNNFLLATDAYNCVDTAGLYWISRSVGGTNININRLADLGTSEVDLRAVTRNVNGAADGLWTGLLARRSFLKVLSSVLLDDCEIISPEIERRHA